jgi:hypothetical protein
MQTGNNDLKKKTIKTMKGKKAFKDEIITRLSLTECKKIWYDAHKRLYRMYADHQDLPKEKLVRGLLFFCAINRIE